MPVNHLLGCRQLGEGNTDIVLTSVMALYLDRLPIIACQCSTNLAMFGMVDDEEKGKGDGAVPVLSLFSELSIAIDDDVLSSYA